MTTKASKKPVDRPKFSQEYMYTDNLESYLLPLLPDAQELWIAAGLMSKGGLAYLDGTQAKIHLLVGIDLPTPPNILRKLLDKVQRAELDCRVYSNSETFFHPKLYIVKSSHRYFGVVGSGNFTTGGWKNNIELFWTIESEQECRRLINWFQHYMDAGIYLTEPFIADYEYRVFQSTAAANQRRKAALGAFKRDYDDEADYPQFFRKADFEAFAGDRPTNKNEQAKAERRAVRQKFYELHKRLYPGIERGGFDLHPHWSKNNIVSLHYHSTRNRRILNGMWLFYGKSESEVKASRDRYNTKLSPNDHVRLQIIIREELVGIWCAVGKENGSGADRRALQEKLKDSKNRERLYHLIKALGDNYFIEISGKPQIKIKEVGTARQLYDIVSVDDFGKYFIIGLNLDTTDNRLRDDKIVPFILDEFSKLYPLFSFIKAPISDEI